MTAISDSTPLVPPALKRFSLENTKPSNSEVLTECIDAVGQQNNGYTNTSQNSNSLPRTGRSTINGVVSQFNQLRYKRSAMDRMSSAFGGIIRRICGRGDRGLPLLDDPEESHVSDDNTDTPDQTCVPAATQELFSNLTFNNEMSDCFSNISIDSITNLRSPRNEETVEIAAEDVHNCSTEVNVSTDYRPSRWNTKRLRWTSSPKKYYELCDDMYTCNDPPNKLDLKPNVDGMLSNKLGDSIGKDTPFGEYTLDDEGGESLQSTPVYQDTSRLNAIFRSIRNLHWKRRTKKSMATVTDQGPESVDIGSPKASSLSLDNDWDPWDSAALETAMDDWSPGSLRRRSSSYDVLTARDSCLSFNQFSDVSGDMNMNSALPSRLCFSAMATVGRGNDKTAANPSPLAYSKSDNSIECNQCPTRNLGHLAGLVNCALSQSVQDLVIGDQSQGTVQI